MTESQFQSRLIKELKETFKGCVIVKNDPNYCQGFPDLTILYKNKWAVLECKRCGDANRRPNQTHYVDLLNSMSYANFVCPENKEEVIREIRAAFGT